MTLAQLNAKIDTTMHNPQQRAEARYLRDERLGMLCGDEEPTEEQVQIVHAQLFPPTP